MTITPENQGFSLLDDTGSVVDISDANNPRPIIDLAGGAARTFTIRYEPTGGNDTDGVLTIRTNADNFANAGGLVSVPLTLSGAILPISKLTDSLSTSVALVRVRATPSRLS